MAETVLDASALMAVLRSEPGAAIVEAAFPDVVISAFNLAEVLAAAVDGGKSLNDAQGEIASLPLRVVAFEGEQIHRSAALRSATRSRGLSLAERACLALAKLLRSPVLTTDRAWLGLELGVKIRLIR